MTVLSILTTMMFVLGRTTIRASAFLHPQPPLLRLSPRGVATSTYRSHDHNPSSNVLTQVQETVDNVLSQYSPQDLQNKDFVHTLDPSGREAFGVAQILHKRLESFHRPGVNCPRCWFQKAHCICSQCPPISLAHLPLINRIFVIMNHKEICLTVDTAKLILSSFPIQSRLVVAGIGPEYQATMEELHQSIENNNCLVLFPTDDAKTFQEIAVQGNAIEESPYGGYDLIVIDGTWAQARKIHTRLLHDNPTLKSVQLSEESLATLNASSQGQGHSQLRRHPIDRRTISTMEATRLLLKDIATASDKQHPPFWEDLLQYQQRVNDAALRQLGPPRAKQKLKR